MSLKQELIDQGHMTVQDLINKLDEVEDKTVPITPDVQDGDGGGTIELIDHVLCYGYDKDGKLEEIHITIKA